MKRFAVVLRKGLDIGAAINSAAIVVGGLRSEGFEEAITDRNGHRHAAVRWNMPVLKAKTGNQLNRLLGAADDAGVVSVAFTRQGQCLSNSFEEYTRLVADSDTDALEILAVGLFGPDEVVREITRSFSVYT